jgi:hypothetical protein
MTEGLRGKGVEANVLLLQTEKWGHAVSRYMYPKGENKLWCWDQNWKSLRLRAYKDDPYSVGRAWMRATQHTERLTGAEFL